MSGKVGGITFLSINGVRYPCKGDVEYEMGVPKRTVVTGHDGVHGFTEEPRPGRAKTIITDSFGTDLRALLTVENALIVLELANKKVLTFPEAWQGGDNQVNTKEGEIGVEFFSDFAEEA